MFRVEIRFLSFLCTQSDSYVVGALPTCVNVSVGDIILAPR